MRAKGFSGPCGNKELTGQFYNVAPNNTAAMRTLAFATLLLMVVSGGIGSTAAAEAQDCLIIPGRSIGDFWLGQDLTNLFALLGPLHDGRDLPTHEFAGYYWPFRRLGAVVDRRTNKVVALAVALDSTYQTESGIGVGVTLDAVRRVFGPEDAVHPGQAADRLVYDALGIAFTVGDASGAADDWVSGVFVFVPGHAREIFPP
jgi:hypothetical protein